MYEIRVCVTLKCNYHCSYCSRDGEGIFSLNHELSNEEIIQRILDMTKIGVNSVRLTGGEPFCRTDLLELAYKIRETVGINRLSIVTNGSLITDKIIKQLSMDNPFEYISVSLDTLKPQKYKSITQKDTLDIVLRNIIALSRNGIKTRVNYVLTSENVDEAEDLLEFCIREKVNLKVLDLYNNTENYVTSSIVECIVKEKGLQFCREERLPGNLGTPMKVYGGYGKIQ